MGERYSGYEQVRRYLSLHPAVALSPITDLHFFDEHLFEQGEKKLIEHFVEMYQSHIEALDIETLKISDIDYGRHLLQRLEIAQDVQRYKSYISSLAEQGERLCGDSTWRYCRLNAGEYEKIQQVFKQVKFVYTVRNPADLACILASDTIGFAPDLGLTGLQTSVSRQDVLVLFYERIIDPRLCVNEFERLTHFLGIDPEKEHIETGGSEEDYSNEPAQRLQQRDKLASHYRAFDKYCEGDLPDSWVRDIKELGE